MQTQPQQVERITINQLIARAGINAAATIIANITDRNIAQDTYGDTSFEMGGVRYIIMLNVEVQ